MSSEQAISNDDKAVTGKSTEALKLRLLNATLRHAREQSEFYHERIPEGFVERITSIGDLEALPILTKEEIEAAGSRIICRDSPPEIFKTSRGTTGQPLLVPISRKEIDAYNDTLRELGFWKRNYPPNTLFLDIDDDVHGERLTGALLPFPHLCVTIYGRDSLEGAARHLFREHTQIGNGAYVTDLMGDLVKFTTYLVSEERDPRASHVRNLYFAGRGVSDKWRSILTEVWGGADQSEVYGLSEVFGGASRCQRCGRYHLSPYVIPEVLDPFNRSRLEDGIGVLVLTTLIPFVRSRPMIRYWTGDIVNAVRTSCPGDRFHRLGIEIKGRLRDAVRLGPLAPNRLALFPYDVLAAVDEIPDIRRAVHSIDRLAIAEGIAGFEYVGFPIYAASIKEVTPDRIGLMVSFELRYPPRLFPQRTKELQTVIASRLISCCHEIRELVETGRLELSVELHGPRIKSAYPSDLADQEPKPRFS